jgi:hypothetical protein
VTTYEEWQVAGTWGEEPYEFTWSPARGYGTTDPEAEARSFIAKMRERGVWWTVGPHLHKRTVTVTEWTEADA